MSTNTYSHYGISAKSNRMNTADLTVGQILVRRNQSRYTDDVDYTNWVIVKILKNRLVIRREGAADAARDVRIIVKNSKSYPYSNGEVENGYEGMSQWDRNSYHLFTQDDEQLAEYKQRDEATIIRVAAEAKSKAAIAILNEHPLYAPTLDELEKAIALLNEHRQYLIANPKESE